MGFNFQDFLDLSEGEIHEQIMTNADNFGLLYAYDYLAKDWR